MLSSLGIYEHSVYFKILAPAKKFFGNSGLILKHSHCLPRLTFVANIEVQKLGYAFTGERASCYSADLLLRQYKRIRDLRKENFSYKDIAPVYTIVFLEKSPSIFKEYKDVFIHKFSTVSDTGLKINMLQNFIFIPVDIFLENLHNNGMRNKLDACQNTERMMTMFFSEELKILDNNTVKYMMDQLEEEVKEQKAQIIEKDAEIAELKAKLAKYQAVTKN